MYTVNVSFKDILRIGTADSSFSVIWTGLVHYYVHVFLQVSVHSPLSFTSAHFVSFTGPVSSSSVVPRSLNLRRSPVLLPFTGSQTCLAHQSAFPFVHGSTHLCHSLFPASSILHRSSVPLLFPGPHLLSLTAPRTCLFHRFPLPSSFIGSHFPCCSSAPGMCTMCVCIWGCSIY
jgi:hypothetical protein